MTWMFVICAALVVYTYAGYPALLWVLSAIKQRPVAKKSYEPSISIVMAVHNGASALAKKFANIRSSDYPADRLEICVASDGSTDETDSLLESLAGTVKSVRCARVGKSAALNQALALSTGEIVVLADVRQVIEPTAFKELAANFADTSIGCVSGELMFRANSGGATEGVSLYWQLEKAIRKLESATGSVVGATGALYAVRRELIPVVPEGTLLDDVFIPLSIQRSGHRVIFEPNARAWDDVAATAGHEFRRKVRTLAGNFQLLQLAPWALVNPFTSFRFISHKLMRLAVPWLLLAVLLISYLRFDNPQFRGLAIAQTAAYLMGAATLLWRPLQRVRLANAASAFIVLNSAAAIALFSFLRHKQAPTRIWNVQTKVDAAAQVPKSTQKAG